MVGDKMSIHPKILLSQPNRPFRAWCQKVLPLVYDDSLSYYELLCKLIHYINLIMREINDISHDIIELYEALMKLQDEMDEIIQEKLDEMAENGELFEAVEKYLIAWTRYPLFDGKHTATMQTWRNLPGIQSPFPSVEDQDAVETNKFDNVGHEIEMWDKNEYASGTGITMTRDCFSGNKVGLTSELPYDYFKVGMLVLLGPNGITKDNWTYVGKAVDYTVDTDGIPYITVDMWLDRDGNVVTPTSFEYVWINPATRFFVSHESVHIDGPDTGFEGVTGYRTDIYEGEEAEGTTTAFEAHLHGDRDGDIAFYSDSEDNSAWKTVVKSEGNKSENILDVENDSDTTIINNGKVSTDFIQNNGNISDDVIKNSGTVNNDFVGNNGKVSDNFVENSGDIGANFVKNTGAVTKDFIDNAANIGNDFINNSGKINNDFIENSGNVSGNLVYNDGSVSKDIIHNEGSSANTVNSTEAPLTDVLQIEGHDWLTGERVSLMNRWAVRTTTTAQTMSSREDYGTNNIISISGGHDTFTATLGNWEGDRTGQSNVLINNNDNKLKVTISGATLVDGSSTFTMRANSAVMIDFISDSLYSVVGITDEYLQFIYDAIEEVYNVLDAKIDKEIQDRKDADTVLQNEIDQEIQDRKDADKELQDEIDAERKAREDADKELQDGLDQEIQDRKDADEELQDEIDNIDSSVTVIYNDVTNIINEISLNYENMFTNVAGYKCSNQFVLQALTSGLAINSPANWESEGYTTTDFVNYVSPPSGYDVVYVAMNGYVEDDNFYASGNNGLTIITAPVSTDVYVKNASGTNKAIQRPTIVGNYYDYDNGVRTLKLHLTADSFFDIFTLGSMLHGKDNLGFMLNDNGHAMGSCFARSDLNTLWRCCCALYVPELPSTIYNTEVTQHMPRIWNLGAFKPASDGSYTTDDHSYDDIFQIRNDDLDGEVTKLQYPSLSWDVEYRASIIGKWIFIFPNSIADGFNQGAGANLAKYGSYSYVNSGYYDATANRSYKIGNFGRLALDITIDVTGKK